MFTKFLLREKRRNTGGIRKRLRIRTITELITGLKLKFYKEETRLPLLNGGLDITGSFGETVRSQALLVDTGYSKEGAEVLTWVTESRSLES